MWSRLDLLLYELKPAMDSSLSQGRPYYGAVEIHICTTVNILPPLALEEAVVFLSLLIIKKKKFFSVHLSFIRYKTQTVVTNT